MDHRIVLSFESICIPLNVYNLSSDANILIMWDDIDKQLLLSPFPSVAYTRAFSPIEENVIKSCRQAIFLAVALFIAGKEPAFQRRTNGLSLYARSAWIKPSASFNQAHVA